MSDLKNERIEEKIYSIVFFRISELTSVEVLKIR